MKRISVRWAQGRSGWASAARNTFAGVAMAALLAACGGGGGQLPSTGVERRPLTADFIARQAVNYSPYRTANRESETITKAQIEEDLRLVRRAGFGLIRLFSSDEMVGRQTLEVIRDTNLDLKVQLGIWIGPDEAANQDQIARGIALANEFQSIVATVSVGNEAMVSWSGHRPGFGMEAVRQVAGFIRDVRSQVGQPVTTDDNWALFAGIDYATWCTNRNPVDETKCLVPLTGERLDPRSILDAVDYVAMHTYPMIDTKYDGIALWDWRRKDVSNQLRAAAMMDGAVAKARKDHDAVRAHLRKVGHADMPVIIGETGWKAQIADSEIFRAHPVNQKMYLDRLRAWSAEGAGTAPDKIFWFQAFDEPWKQGDDKWGLFDVQRRARYAVQGLFPQEEWTSDRFVDSDALFHRPFQVVAPVQADRYTISADGAVTGEARPAQALSAIAWAGGSAVQTNVDDAAEGSSVLRVTPGPAEWGWGFALSMSNDDLIAEDLSSFAAQGFLNLSIRTTYPGVIEVGFLTGSNGDESAYLKMVKLDPALRPYGYANEGEWHTLKIPLSDLVGRRPFGEFISTLDFSKVTQPFVIADDYEQTGNKTAGFAGNTTPIEVDGIFWSR